MHCGTLWPEGADAFSDRSCRNALDASTRTATQRGARAMTLHATRGATVRRFRWSRLRFEPGAWWVVAGRKIWEWMR